MSSTDTSDQLAGSSLALRHRPTRFSELVGQDLPARALRSRAAGESGLQSYLLTGPRGCGKTTSARILAAALNCEQPANGEPCTTCRPCRNIRSGNWVDVQEIDAASKRSVADARALLAGLLTVPSEGEYRVIILDEAHMLTLEAANALLKSLEEPPAHIIWVLVTTDPQRLPDTVRSRCQELQYRLVDPAVMADHLRAVAATDGIEVNQSQIDEAVRRGGGSVRDAMRSLEVVLHGDDTPAAEDATDLVDALASADLSATLKAIAEAARAGAQMRILAENAEARVRDAFLVKMGAPELASHTALQLSSLTEVHPRVLTSALESLGDAMVAMRGGHDERVSLEVDLARHCATNR